MSVIPVIDVADTLAGRPGALARAAREVQEALTTVGFFVLTGHDVPPPLIARTFDAARRFHQLPMPAKLALKLNEHINGYMVMGRYAVRTSDLNDNTEGDLNEAFFVKRERPPDDPLRRSGRRFVGPNQWPAEATLPGFRAHVLEYTDAMDAFARRFLPVVAAALDLPPDWFDQAFTDSQFTFRLSHYPPVKAEPNQFGIAPHTDSNFMTFLAQTEVPGLQIRLPPNGSNGGDWVDVPYVPNSFAVNSGDMLHRWSNARLKSTPHRALPPIGRDRYAIPFFLGPRFDQVIECLPSCAGPGNPPRWPPITYADWQAYWYDANYDPKHQRDVA
ncbi:MAG TPA: 2-oxoglutarate and iron-dependent oxygenase domain-containing protein [Stellaceae bacterium]|jgi:isopenicillin N synthase-like dioxygenase|nr:2-oxoglutarate and iron-dependent oxygenase domain-containing protein [Stellaceae bacterium]